MVRNINRFEIWLINLDPTFGKEIQKTKPCVIISPNEMKALHTTIIAPLTSKEVSKVLIDMFSF